VDKILSVLIRELPNQSSRFVFPSEAASSLWAQKICGLAAIRSVALNRFLAWDRFKERIIRAEVQDREPVTAIIRKLFAQALVRKNAEAMRKAKAGTDTSKTPPAGHEGESTTPHLVAGYEPTCKPVLPFRSLIPPAFAGEGAVFAPRIAKLLPSLALFKNRREAAMGAAANAAL